MYMSCLSVWFIIYMISMNKFQKNNFVLFPIFLLILAILGLVAYMIVWYRDTKIMYHLNINRYDKFVE